jgi:hypothetical protein
MSLSNARTLFGVHSASFYNPNTSEFYGIAKVLGELSVNLSGELLELRGGSSPYPVAIETGPINSEISAKFKEYPNFLFELLLGKAPTSNAAEASGNVSTPVDVTGTSVMHATTGIASVQAIPSTGAANLKAGKYVLKATDATHVDIYASSDVDFGRGTDASFENDALKITASPLEVVSGDDTDLAAYGLQITGGSGTIALVAGDTAEFYVRPVNAGSMTVRVGATADSFPEFGAIMYAQKNGRGEIWEFEIFRCRAIGMPFAFAEKAFSEAEVTMKAFYDSEKDGVFDIRMISQ